MKKLEYILLIMCVVFGTACEQLEIPTIDSLELQLTSHEIIINEDNSISIRCTLATNHKGASLIVHYSKDSDYGKIEKKQTMNKNGEAYEADLGFLRVNTTYYVRYAVSLPYSKVMYLQETDQFVTREVNHCEYVDLGLSVKWATMNVGASNPEDYGDYFAWGETEPKDVYDWSTYKWCNGSYTSLTKYNTSSSYGTVDNKTTLELSDDAARANWDGSWRMPTDAELTELREQCTWTWTTQNGVNGYRVTSKSNGNSIFLPAAYFRTNQPLYGTGSSGFYWSSSLNMDSPDLAWSVYFRLGYVKREDDHNRFYGQSVRPVCP